MTKPSLMCIGAHGDAIEFNAGGTCLKYFDSGDKIDYVMSTNNMSGRFHIVEKDNTVTHKEGEPTIMEPIRKREAAGKKVQNHAHSQKCPKDRDGVSANRI